MITHNGTYLLFATHHGMPIYAATMGGKMILDGKWLLPATQLAIVAAFGSAEGTEVIAKTNDYLNRIATTDPQRALQISGFINEDPLLVCSLVETSKVRTLTGTANAYIDTGYKPTSTTILEAFYALVVSEYSSCGSRLNYGTDMFVIHNGPNIQFNIGTQTVTTGINTSLNTFYKLRLDAQGKAFVNDNVWNTNKFNGNNFNIWLFANNNGGAVHNSNGAIYEYATIYEGAYQVAHFIPMLRTDGTCGMLDIISGTFHPNANTEGTFTIQLTDKTPA
jgi:hypothetical protein